MNTVRKVLISIPCLQRGGTEMQTLQLVKVLSESGYKVSTVCYFEHKDDVVAEYKQAGSEVILLDLNRSISPVKLVFTLKSAFKALKPDVVHVQYMAPGALAVVAARLAGVKKLLATVHQPYTSLHGIKAKLLLRLSATLCTKFICVSQNAEISWFGTAQLYDAEMAAVKQARHFTIYNAIDVDKIEQISADTDVLMEKAELGIATNKIVMGAVSRLTYEKGIDILINAFAKLCKEFDNVHLLIVGTSTEETKLKQLVLEKKIAGQCTFTGLTAWERAMQLMSVMDMVVIPSRFEGFGLTAAEALAMHKTVIASNVFGLQEVVPAEVGYQFESENSESLSNIMATLIQQADIPNEKKQSVNQFCKSQFDISVFKQQINSLYQNL